MKFCLFFPAVRFVRTFYWPRCCVNYAVNFPQLVYLRHRSRTMLRSHIYRVLTMRITKMGPDRISTHHMCGWILFFRQHPTSHLERSTPFLTIRFFWEEFKKRFWEKGFCSGSKKIDLRALLRLFWILRQGSIQTKTFSWLFSMLVVKWVCQ